MIRILLLAPLVAACGGGDSSTPPDGPSTQAGWTPLVTRTWTLAPGEERESELEIVTLDRDVYVGGIRPIAPPGTHHTLLFRGLAAVNAIYASGVGTNELVFPAGLGLKLTAGTALGLQLHIYNVSDEPMTQTSGVEVLEVDPASVTEEVDMFLPGPKNLTILPNQTTTIAGTCTLKAAQHVFALFPHMHQLGAHFKTTLGIGGAPRVLHDAAYDFDHQPVISFEPIALAAGDTITTECTWNNPTSATVTYGESTDTEMCYSLLYRYPKQPEEFCQQ